MVVVVIDVVVEVGMVVVGVVVMVVLVVVVVGVVVVRNWVGFRVRDCVEYLASRLAKRAIPANAPLGDNVRNFNLLK